MNNDNVNWDDFSKMNEMDQIKNEEAFIHHAFLNSYRLLIGNVTYERFLEEGETKGPLTFMHDITMSDDPDPDDVLNLIDYFANLDDFDKCIMLRDRFIKKKKSK
jgi:hypothetical protein